MRAIRLATVLDFEIDSSLDKAISENYKLVKSLSKMRIREEMDKILKSTNYQKGLNLLEKYGILKLVGISYEKIVYVDDLNGMWSQLKIIDMPFTNKEKKSIINITEIVNNKEINKYTLYRYGLDISLIAGTILGINKKEIIDLRNNLPIKSIKDIDITSDELIELIGISKTNIGKVYARLEYAILNNEIKNEKAKIINYLLER